MVWLGLLAACFGGGRQPGTSSVSGCVGLYLLLVMPPWEAAWDFCASVSLGKISLLRFFAFPPDLMQCSIPWVWTLAGSLGAAAWREVGAVCGPGWESGGLHAPHLWTEMLGPL